MEPITTDTNDSSGERKQSVKEVFNRHLRNIESGTVIDSADSLRHKSDRVLDAIMGALKELDKDVSIDQAISALGLVETDSPHAKKLLYEYLVQESLKTKFVFHAFNGVFEESINQHGLDPNMRLFDQGELDTVRANSGAESSTLLGWQQSSKGKIYLLGISSDTMRSPIYRYAVSSPEWFAQFCQGGSRFYNDSRFDNEAFMRRDYEASKRNIETYLSDSSATINEAEKASILELFEKYWNIFVSPESAPKLAIIDAYAVKDDLRNIPYERLVELGHDRYRDGREIPIDLLAARTVESMLREQDFAVTHAIPVKNIIIVDLPSLTDDQETLPQAGD